MLVAMALASISCLALAMSTLPRSEGLYMRRVAHSPRASADPFRPAQPPIEPMIINAVAKLLSGDGGDSSQVAAAALEGRRADPDYVLDADEESQLTQRVASVAAASSELLELLQMLVNACPWISKFNAMPSFGIGSVNDPYCRLCRAECMLALLILHVEGGQVSFLEEERLEVLSDVPPSAETALEAVRTAVASCPSG